MTSKRFDHFEFAAIVAKETNGRFNTSQIAHLCNDLARLTRFHRTACERYCNEADFKPETIDRIEIRIVKALEASGMGARFQHDPRGATVKLTVPSGFQNDGGQEAGGVPGQPARNSPGA